MSNPNLQDIQWTERPTSLVLHVHTGLESHQGVTWEILGDTILVNLNSERVTEEQHTFRIKHLLWMRKEIRLPAWVDPESVELSFHIAQINILIPKHGVLRRTDHED